MTWPALYVGVDLPLAAEIEIADAEVSPLVKPIERDEGTFADAPGRIRTDDSRIKSPELCP